MVTKQIAITKTYNLAKPAEVLVMAKTLKEYVIKEKLYADIKGKNYAMVEGWQFAGFLSGLEILLEEPKNLSTGTEIKWSCTAKLYSGEKVVGVGYALCSSKEASKKSFDEYAILSMAQTRAIGKAFRNKIGWIMKLAGYQSTPAEEMTKVDETMKEPVVEYGSSPAKKDTSVVLKKGQVIGPNGTPCYLSSESGDPISNEEYEFSMKRYGRALSRAEQKDAKPKR